MNQGLPLALAAGISSSPALSGGKLLHDRNEEPCNGQTRLKYQQPVPQNDSNLPQHLAVTRSTITRPISYNALEYECSLLENVEVEAVSSALDEVDPENGLPTVTNHGECQASNPN